MEQLLATFRFYDNRGRRLSIFGEYNKETQQLDIVVFTCSKKDMFSKRKTQNYYRMFINNERQPFVTYHLLQQRDEKGIFTGEVIQIQEKINPQQFSIPCVENKTKVPFMEWCKANFRKMHEAIVHVQGNLISVTHERAKWKEIRGNVHKADSFLKVRALF